MPRCVVNSPFNLCIRHKSSLVGFDDILKSRNEKLEKVKLELHDHGDIMVHLRLNLMSVLGKLDKETPARSRMKADIKVHLKTLLILVKKLVEEVGSYEALFHEQETDKYAQYYTRQPHVPLRLVRVGGPQQE